MIFVTGDTHGTHDFHKLNSKNFPEQKSMTREDYLIICGDFGAIWNGDAEDQWLLNWYNTRNYTTAFVDGNHENHSLLNSYPVEEWNGGLVHRIMPNVVHLMRGQVFTLQGSTFFTFGGAMSTDKETRKEFISWWQQELPNYQEIDQALANLSAHNNQVDYIITHTAPTHVVRRLIGQYMVEDPIGRPLDEIFMRTTFKRWFFGHLHLDQTWDRFTALFEKVRQVK